MKDTLRYLLIKYKIPIRVILCSLVAIVVILYLLSHVPITKSMHYDMRGFIVSPEGEILEQFDFTITGKDYNFIIDPPGGVISHQGEELTQLEDDALILYFEWDLDSINEKYGFGHLIVHPYPEDNTYTCGSLGFYNKQLNHYDSEPYALIDLENGTFCMYAETLADNAFIIGVTDPNADPTALIQPYLDRIRTPELED